MKDLTPLEKEFFKILSGNDYNPDEGDDFTQTVVITAKEVAALCERKMIDLVGWVTQQDTETLLMRTDLLIKKYLTEKP